MSRRFNRWLLAQLNNAFYEARKAKRRTRDERNFEVFLPENLKKLASSIILRQYEPSRGIAFITRRPVIREIFAAPFRDRVIHHFLFNQCAEWWDRRFIYDSYSCRKGKGTLFGIQRLKHHIRSVSQNYSKKTYVIKMDIQGYFMSLPRKALYERIVWGLDRQFADNEARKDLLKYLWRKIIFDDPIKGVKRRGSIHDWDNLPDSKSLFRQKPGFGIVIGNLTSQLLSNIYLDQLDRYVIHTLGYKHYGRYVDDFYIVVTEDKLTQAKRDIEKIRKYLKSINLTLHPKKTKIQEINRGVEFLGVVIYPYRIVMGKRYKTHFYEAAAEVGMGRKGIETVVSYLGHARHFDGQKLASRIFERVGWRYMFYRKDVKPE